MTDEEFKFDPKIYISAPPNLPLQGWNVKTTSIEPFLRRKRGSEKEVERANLEEHEATDSLLRSEIQDAMIDDDPDIIFTTIPKDSVPFDAWKVYKELKDDKGVPLYDETTRKWHTCPGHNNAKMSLCVFFETLAIAVSTLICVRGSRLMGILRRHWSDKWDKKPVPHASCVRKPDGVMLPLSPLLLPLSMMIAWCLFYMTSEFKNNENARPNAIFQIADQARLMFSTQLNRRYILGLTFTGTLLTVVGFDRAGLVASRPVDIHKEPALFLHVIVGCLFLDPNEFGLDPTVRLSATKNEIQVGNDWYDIIAIKHVEGGLRGRGTVCYHVRRDGKDYIVKDRWVDSQHAEREETVLKKLAGLKHIPRFVKDEPVLYNGKPDSTEFLRQSEKARAASTEVRMHRRMLLEPVGRDIGAFRDLVELLTAIRDIVDAIEDLFDRDLVHRDVSYANIVLEKIADELRGLLIDYDYASGLDQQDQLAVGFRTGTLPFMACEIMDSEPEEVVKHCYYHDLESLFYVLIWTCTMFEGPCGKLRDKSFEYRDSCVSLWNGGQDVERVSVGTVSDAKLAVMVDEGKFEKKVLKQIAPYFEDVKDCMRLLRKLLFDKGVGREENRETAQTSMNNEEYSGQLRGIPGMMNLVSHVAVLAPRSNPKAFIGQYRTILNITIDKLSINRDPSALPPIKTKTSSDPKTYENLFYTDTWAKGSKKPRKLASFKRRGLGAKKGKVNRPSASKRQSEGDAMQRVVLPSKSATAKLRSYTKRAKTTNDAYMVVVPQAASGSKAVVDEDASEEKESDPKA